MELDTIARNQYPVPVCHFLPLIFRGEARQKSLVQSVGKEARQLWKSARVRDVEEQGQDELGKTGHGNTSMKLSKILYKSAMDAAGAILSKPTRAAA